MVLDPFDMLVRLGKITQANVQAADLVESAVGTSTRAARLVAIGVDKQKLLEALSELTRMPIATPEILASAAPMQLPPSYRAMMKELLAVPIGRVDEHILDVAIADPRTTKKLRDAAIAHRPRLALEPDILEALARVFPETEALDPLSEPTLKTVSLAPLPVSVADGLFDKERQAEAPAVPQPVQIGADNELAPPIPCDQLGGPVSVTSPRPFAATASQVEVTQRVRHRPDREDRATSPAGRLAQSARALADRVRANVGARTLSMIAVIAVIVAVAVLAFVVSAKPDTDGAAHDAGALVGDGSEESTPPLTTSPTPTSGIEKSASEPPPKLKRKPPRQQRKKRR